MTRIILETCGLDYNSDNWEPEFMTIFVIWQLIVTLDSIRNSCDVCLFVSHSKKGVGGFHPCNWFTNYSCCPKHRLNANRAQESLKLCMYMRHWRTVKGKTPICSFLAVHNSSIGDLVTHWLTHWLSEPLLVFYQTQVSLGSDLWVRLSQTNLKTFGRLHLCDSCW